MNTITEWINNDTTTVVFCIIILSVFFFFLLQAIGLQRLSFLIIKINSKDDILQSLENTKLNNLKQQFEQTINIKTPKGNKTNTPSSIYFDEFRLCKAFDFNLRLLDTAAGTLVGLGLLGTFLGLTLGVRGIDITDSSKISESIKQLLGGMGTAFMTSLFGMALSLIYTFVDKLCKHSLAKSLSDFTERLDDLYYIDDTRLAQLQQEEMMTNFYGNVRLLIEKQSTEIVRELKGTLIYDDANGNKVPVCNAIRDILLENNEQSKALKSFSTDLAIEMNDRLDETMSRQMQENIIPLMGDLNKTAGDIVKHIDLLSKDIASPATDIIEKVVEELKKSIDVVLNEFKSSLSGSATKELERLALQLGSATDAMAKFPQNMEDISLTLQATIKDVQSVVSEISKTSATANSEAMQEMQKQTTLATNAIRDAINDVKSVMTDVSNSTQLHSEQTINKMSDATQQMTALVQQTVQNISGGLSDQQLSILSLHEGVINEIKNLLKTFEVGLNHLEKVNGLLFQTMGQFGEAQNSITDTTINLKAISGNMDVSTKKFSDTVMEHSNKIGVIQQDTERGIAAVKDILHNADELSEGYVKKFGIIEGGLQGIFSQIQNGLTEYSHIVIASNQKYLESYSASLTQTADALSNTIQQLNEVVEMLVESINTRKR